jgi:hypothetical protein
MNEGRCDERLQAECRENIAHVSPLEVMGSQFEIYYESRKRELKLGLFIMNKKNER